jgi:hypothetical protein
MSEDGEGAREEDLPPSPAAVGGCRSGAAPTQLRFSGSREKTRFHAMRETEGYAPAGLVSTRFRGSDFGIQRGRGAVARGWAWKVSQFPWLNSTTIPNA